VEALGDGRLGGKNCLRLEFFAELLFVLLLLLLVLLPPVEVAPAMGEILAWTSPLPIM
jgi:hypothetical protein